MPRDWRSEANLDGVKEGLRNPAATRTSMIRTREEHSKEVRANATSQGWKHLKSLKEYIFLKVCLGYTVPVWGTVVGTPLH